MGDRLQKLKPVFQKWLSFPRALFVALVAATVVWAPSLWSGFFLDDYMHLAVLEGLPTPAGKLDLFRFASGDPEQIRPFVERGPYPWWTHPQLKLAFFRPVSSLLANVDHALFGRWAPGYHAHSMLWYLLTLVAVSMLFRRLLPIPVAAGALILFAVDANHWTPVGWIANRNALVAVAPALFGLVAHLRWREHQWRWGLPLSVLGFAMGLLGGETAVAVLAYVFAYEVCGARDGVRNRVLGLMPAVLTGLAYVAIYKLWNYGAWGSGIYLDPTQSPRDFLLAAAPRYFALLASGLWHVPADLWLFLQSSRPFLVLAGAVSLALGVWAGRQTYRAVDANTQRGLRWLLLGAALSLLPVLATFPANRLLFVPSLGISALFAVMAARAFSGAAGVRKRFVSVVCVFLGLHAVAALLIWPGQPWAFGTAMQVAIASIRRSEVDEAKAPDQRFIILNAPDPVSGLYTPIIRSLEGYQRPYAWQVMMMVPHDVRFTRTGERRFELEVVGGRMLDTVFEQLVRSESLPLSTAEPYPLAGAVVRVKELDGVLPRKIAVELDGPLEDPRWAFLEWRDAALRVFKLPAVGQSVSIVYRHDPLEL